MLVMVMVMVMVVRLTSCLLPLTSYLLPLTQKKKKSQRTDGGRSCGGQRIQSTELAGWLHGSMLRKSSAGQDRAGQMMQMMQMMNVSTETNPPIHPLSRAKATLPRQASKSRIGQGSAWLMMQMMNMSTLIDQPIHRLASLPRKSYHSGW